MLNHNRQREIIEFSLFGNGRTIKSCYGRSTKVKQRVPGMRWHVHVDVDVIGSSLRLPTDHASTTLARLETVRIFNILVHGRMGFFIKVSIICSRQFQHLLLDQAPASKKCYAHLSAYVCTQLVTLLVNFSNEENSNGTQWVNYLLKTCHFNLQIGISPTVFIFL